MVEESVCELNKLGWYAFQQLCTTVLSEVLGQSFEIYGPTNDGGRDGAFVGSWSDAKLSGSFAMQATHSSGERRNLGLSDVSDEIDKAGNLAAEGLADIYLVMTNAALTGSTSLAIHRALRDSGVKTPIVHGAQWVESHILKSARLRAIVPRLYGLGDLTQIFDERAYEQAARPSHS